MGMIDLDGSFLKCQHQHYKDFARVIIMVKLTSGQAVHNGKGIILLRQ